MSTRARDRAAVVSGFVARVAARVAAGLVAGLAMGGAGVAMAQVHEGDIILEVAGGVIDTGRLASGGGAGGGGFEPLRVFLAELGQNAPNVASDPGFDCFPGTFPVGTRNGLVLMGPLMEWDGAGGVGELVGSDAEFLRVEYLTLATNGPGPGAAATDEVATFTISIQSNGQWHRHVRWVLREPEAVGVYAQRMRLVSTSAGIGASEPFWLVLRQGGAAQADVDAVVALVSDEVSPPPPPPECPACAADFDQDGGVTGADVEAFFLAFEAGDACGDTDQDGGVTGADVEAFFLAFEAGGC